jgi:phosphonate transport system permease protein
MPTRDPAFVQRVFWFSLALVLFWPLGLATEFRLWVLWEPDNRKVTTDFVGSFWPLVYNAEFMQMVVRETWRTVAMATAGVTLALVLAVPLSL